MESSQKEEKQAAGTKNKVSVFFTQHWKDLLYLLIFASIIVGLDQLTKAWVRSNIPMGQDWLPPSLSWLSPFARLRHTFNFGAAFGLFQQGGMVFAVLAVIVSVLIISYFPSVSRQDWWLRVALSMQLGGAIGNLIDRIRFGSVTDFISVGNFAIFNIADASITVGVGILILGIWTMESKLKKEKQAGK